MATRTKKAPMSDTHKEALAEGRELEGLEVRRPSLEDVYLSLVQEEEPA